MADAEVKKLKDLRVVDLKAELERRFLDTTGEKIVLKERLNQAIRDEGHDPDEFLFEIDSEAADLKADFVETVEIKDDGDYFEEVDRVGEVEDEGHEEASATNFDAHEDKEAADMETSDPEEETQDKLTTVSGGLTTSHKKQALARVVTPLSYNNWPTWEVEFQSVLLINGVAPDDYDAELSDDPKEKARDKLAYAHLISNVNDKYKRWLLSLNTNSFKVAYDALRARNNSQSVQNLMRAMRAVCKTRLPVGKCIEDHLNRASRHLNILHQGGLTDKMQALLLLETLNNDYEQVRFKIHEWDEACFTLSKVQEALIEHSRTLGQRGPQNQQSRAVPNKFLNQNITRNTPILNNPKPQKQNPAGFPMNFPIDQQMPQKFPGTKQRHSMFNSMPPNKEKIKHCNFCRTNTHFTENCRNLKRHQEALGNSPQSMPQSNLAMKKKRNRPMPMQKIKQMKRSLNIPSDHSDDEETFGIKKPAYEPEGYDFAPPPPRFDSAAGGSGSEYNRDHEDFSYDHSRRQSSGQRKAGRNAYSDEMYESSNRYNRGLPATDETEEEKMMSGMIIKPTSSYRGPGSSREDAFDTRHFESSAGTFNKRSTVSSWSRDTFQPFLAQRPEMYQKSSTSTLRAFEDGNHDDDDIPSVLFKSSSKDSTHKRGNNSRYYE